MIETYEANKEKIPNLDEFENSKNDFLRDIYKKAKVFVLSDKQVWAANKAWENYQVYGGKSPWEVNVEKAPELARVNEIDYNNFLYDIADKAKRYVLSDKQIEVFVNSFQKEAAFVEPVDLEAFHMMAKAVSMASQSTWLPDEVRKLVDTGKIKKRAHDYVIEKAHKYRKSIFGHLFDVKKHTPQNIQYYIQSISLPKK